MWVSEEPNGHMEANIEDSPPSTHQRTSYVEYAKSSPITTSNSPPSPDRGSSCDDILEYDIVQPSLQSPSSSSSSRSSILHCPCCDDPMTVHHTCSTSEDTDDSISHPVENKDTFRDSIACINPLLLNPCSSSSPVQCTSPPVPPPIPPDPIIAYLNNHNDRELERIKSLLEKW